MRRCQSQHPRHQGLGRLKWWWQLGALFTGEPGKGGISGLIPQLKKIFWTIINRSRNQLHKNAKIRIFCKKGTGWKAGGDTMKANPPSIIWRNYILATNLRCKGNITKMGILWRRWIMSHTGPNPETWKRDKPFDIPGCQRQWWELFAGIKWQGRAIPS